jgi:hypothetical protein
LASAVESTGLTEAVSRVGGVERGKTVALRHSLEDLAAVMTDVLASAGLPVLEAGDEAVWAVVVPVSRALRQASKTLQDSGRSPRRLEVALHELRSAAAALVAPPDGEGTTGGYRKLPVVVPGPAPLPMGVVECEIESRVRTLRWYSTGPDGPKGELFAELVGRPEGYQYRWQDKQVWDDLAGDLIMFCCGWGNAPESVPPVLKRSRTLLANQLRTDFYSGEWALDAAEVVDWLVNARVVTRMPQPALH